MYLSFILSYLILSYPTEFIYYFILIYISTLKLNAKRKRNPTQLKPYQ